MKNFARIIIVFLAAFLLASCKAKYKDISGEAEFTKHIGERYVTKSDMDFSGVNAPPGYSDEIHFYVISSRDPGWSGPEVVTRVTFNKGSVVTITKVEECTNCLTFGTPLRHVQVTIDGVESPVDLPIYVYMREILSGKHIEKIQ